MHKRRLSGILKYGSRSYPKRIIKFQGGGFVAVSQAYDWRDDPYEKAIVAQENARYKASLAASKKSKSGKSPNFPKFTTLKGGLYSDNVLANQLFQQKQIEFNKEISDKGIEWLSGFEGQTKYNAIVNYGESLEVKMVADAKDFKESITGMKDDDKNTLAISSNNIVMVRDRDKGKVSFLTMNDYITNIKQYEISTMGDLINWRKNKLSGANKNELSRAFLESGALSRNTMEETYIKPRKDKIQYEIVNNRVFKKADNASGPTIDIGDAKGYQLGMSNLQNGIPFFQGTGMNPTTSNIDINTILENIYGTISGGGDRSTLDASLKAIVLRDPRHIKKLRELKTVEERGVYLAKNSKYELATYIFKKPSGSSKDSEGGVDSGDFMPNSAETNLDQKNKPNANENSDLLLKLTGGTGETSIYISGQKIEDDKVSDFSTGMIEGAIQSGKMKVSGSEAQTSEQLENAKILQNDQLTEQANTSRIYFEDGTELRDIVGKDYNLFLNNEVRLAPNTGADLVLYPVNNKGKLQMSKFKEFRGAKIASRQDFINSMKKNKITINTPANKLFANNLAKGADKEYTMYRTWIANGLKMDDFKAKLDKLSKGSADYTRVLSEYYMAVDANATLKTTKELSSKIFDPTTKFMPYFKTTNYVNDINYNIKEKWEEYNKLKQGGYASYAFRDIGDSADNYMQDIHGIKNGLFNFDFTIDDEIYEINLLMPYKSPKTVSAERGEKTGAGHTLGVFTDAVLNGINNNNNMNSLPTMARLLVD